MKSTVIIGATMAFASLTATSMLGMRVASASEMESAELWNLINDAHLASGCPAYGNAAPLANVALHLAQAMVAHNGAKNAPGGFAPTAENLLNQQGYYPTAIGEMDNFNTVDPRNILSTEPWPSGRQASAKDKAAMEFWESHGTKDLISNCAMQQMEVAVWENGNNWAAVSLTGTPGAAPGPLPQQDQPH